MPRSIGVKRTCYGNRKAECIVKTYGHGIGANLGGGIRRLCLLRVLFINRNILCRSVHFGSRGNYYPDSSKFFCCLANIKGAFYIGIHITVGCHIGIRDGNQSGEVKDDIHVFHDMFHIMRITYIATNNFEVWVGMDILEPASEVKRVVIG